jgi:hypothetical protein
LERKRERKKEREREYERPVATAWFSFHIFFSKLGTNHITFAENHKGLEMMSFLSLDFLLLEVKLEQPTELTLLRRDTTIGNRKKVKSKKMGETSLWLRS